MVAESRKKKIPKKKAEKWILPFDYSCSVQQLKRRGKIFIYMPRLSARFKAKMGMKLQIIEINLKCQLRDSWRNVQEI